MRTFCAAVCSVKGGNGGRVSVSVMQGLPPGERALDAVDHKPAVERLGKESKGALGLGLPADMVTRERP